MKTKLGYIVFMVFSTWVLLQLYGCSQEKNTLLSKGWHNLNARDNSYFLARERTKEIEAEIDAKTQSDYNQVLYPVTIIDTNQTKSYKDKTDDIIKKASIPITRHKNSVFVDNSYILVGKSRILRGEWKLAAETFRFVNAKGEEDERHEGLIQLMRLFMLKKDFRSAGYVLDYLNKQKLSEKNLRDFLLTTAQYDRYLEDYSPMVKNLEKVVPMVKGKREKRARIYFIIGQIYQLQGRDSMAYINYKKAIKHNPPYELSFYSKLYLAQVTSLSNASDKKKTERYFKKLLKDKKNLEYKDKIYYEMALFAYKQKDYPKTLSLLEKSVAANKGNKYQKGASYLKAALINYGDLKNFEQAKLYYDSTVAVWDKADKRYKEIAERQKILEEFVKNLLVVRREDSLQRLAKMDSATLNKHIDKVIAYEAEERLKKEQLAAARKKAQQQQQQAAGGGATIVDNNPSDPSNWYFYNATVVSKGATDFKIKWGNRPLEDNWRRSTKERPIADDKDNTTDSSQSTSTTKDTTASAKANGKETVVDKSAYYKDIPSTPELMAASNKKIQEALYNLGKIYNLKLNEPEDAIKTLENLYKRYPDCEYIPEVLYMLHLINKEQKHDERAEYYKNKLINDFPKSLYARMLINPNYLRDSREENKLVASLYRRAFEYYEQNNYIVADSLLAMYIKTYPENDNLDRMKLLRIIITGKTKNALVYNTQLQNFINDPENEASKLLPKARELLATSEQYLQALSSKGAEIKTSDVRYSTNTSKPHFYMAVFENKKIKQEVVERQFKSYNKRTYPEQDLKIESIKVSDTTFAIVVKTFEAMYPSKLYREKIYESGPLKQLEPMTTATFFITDGNFLLFYKDKNVNTYLEFFKNNY